MDTAGDLRDTEELGRNKGTRGRYRGTRVDKRALRDTKGLGGKCGQGDTDGLIRHGNKRTMGMRGIRGIQRTKGETEELGGYIRGLGDTVGLVLKRD